MNKKKLSKETKIKPELYTLLGVVPWDVDITDFNTPSNMVFSFGSEFDDTSIEAFRKDKDSVRWVIFRVDRTWYVMEQEKAEIHWIENWTKQMNSDVKEAKKYAELEAVKHYT